MKRRLDQELVVRGLIASRSQAENYIRLGQVEVNGIVVSKTGYAVNDRDRVELLAPERYVSRAGLKLSSVARKLRLDFMDKTVLDVGSSTGGFTDYALQHGARRVVAVDVGTDQMHPSLRDDARIELHEKTDIRDFAMPEAPDIVVIDVSFISLRQILPQVVALSAKDTVIAAMVKPQFEASRQQVNRGVIKNDAMRRKILSEFESWSKHYFTIVDKADSEIAGAKGNRERFYKLVPLAK